VDNLTCPTITGEQLRAARDRMGLTRQQLAEALGISNEAVIYRWESGRSRIQTPGLLARAVMHLERDLRSAASVRAAHEMQV